jgi:hypothetical protein
MSFTEVNASLAATKTVLVELGAEGEWTEPIDIRGYRKFLALPVGTSPDFMVATGYCVEPTGFISRSEDSQTFSMASSSDFVGYPIAPSVNLTPPPFFRFSAADEQSQNRSFYLHCSS